MAYCLFYNSFSLLRYWFSFNILSIALVWNRPRQASDQNELSSDERDGTQYDSQICVSRQPEGIFQQDMGHSKGLDPYFITHYFFLENNQFKKISFKIGWFWCFLLYWPLNGHNSSFTRNLISLKKPRDSFWSLEQICLSNFLDVTTVKRVFPKIDFWVIFGDFCTWLAISQELLGILHWTQNWSFFSIILLRIFGL